MIENQKIELENLGREYSGKLLDGSNYVSIDLSNEQVTIEDIWGGSDVYDLTASDLHRAVQNNQGDVKNYFIAIEQILF